MGLVQDSERFIANAWNAVDEMGGDIPPNKNLANLPEGIATIPTGPATPTSLVELKRMVNAGRNITEGTIIPDIYNGQSNPLIVVRYLDGTDESYKNSSGNNIKGVILQRSFVTDVTQKWDDANSNVDYATSTINTFLNNTYLNRCSQEFQNVVTEASIPVVTGYGKKTVTAKWFLPSIEEVYGDANSTAGRGNEGSYFPYWKTKTGLSSPSNATNNGRIVKVNSSTGEAGHWWLRTRDPSNANQVWYVATNGAISYFTAGGVLMGVLPVCFVGKD